MDSETIEAVFAIFFMLLGAALILFITLLIVEKKKVHYRYTDTTKNISFHEYCSRYNGGWIYKDIKLRELLRTYPDDEVLQRRAKNIRLYQTVSLAVFILMMVSAVIRKAVG
ncbi:hypothetical protein AM493_12385 [Flavobacterium akiainvivens]|uniref:Uncharacterized protein n=1 Tax=Flavobacterium akiainvivens TaxID=1202724 RepID=A0A0M8MIW8_9FLAO|nr:hypothetical protein [Flavobacterium akiainvivens]KOS06737.1 hypothetical protein AM493_12385 [Flavobacterium akiainvivens]SFQ74508.1 hypothetical protein SAMN05444144_12032 [Flavobacterium akiainvivens]